MTKQRNSSLELIRLICIFFVVAWHTIGPYVNDMTGGNLVATSFIHAISNNTNLLFMLLSGYFGIRFKLDKLIKLDIAIIFYDLLNLFLFTGFSVKGLVTACMPVIFKTHWFVSCYFVIAFLSPFLNKIPEKLSREKFRALLLLLLLLFYIVPTVFFSEIIEDTGKGVVCMSIMYLVGRYLFLYYKDVHFKRSRLALVCLGSMLLSSALNLVLTRLQGVYMSMFVRDNSILVVVAAVSFFLFFREMHFSNRLINHLVPNVVILYCIEGYGRHILANFIDVSRYQGGPLFLPVLLGFAALVLVGCILVNELRRLILGPVDDMLTNFIMKLIQKITPAIRNFGQKLHALALSFLGANN